MKKLFTTSIMALAFTALALTSLAMGDEKAEQTSESLNIQPCAKADIYRSASNAKGEKILAYQAEAVLDEEGQAGALILAMQSAKGKISPLIEDSYGHLAKLGEMSFGRKTSENLGLEGRK